MRGSRWLLPGLSILLLLTAGAATARPPAGWQEPARSGYGTNIVDLGAAFDINEMRMSVTNLGSFAFDQLVGDSGLEWPKGSSRHVVFASGIWLGAQVNGETRVTVAEYSQEFAAGPMLNDGSGDPADPAQTDERYRVLKLTPDTPATDEDYLLWQQLATELGDDGPPVDGNGDPLLVGDQTLWCVYNDGLEANHNNDAGFTAPLGVEVRQTTFGFNRQGALGKSVFLDFEIENKGSNVLENMYISLWSDPDLGGATDDLVGADTTLSLGYCYNATNTDNNYGANVPAVGYDFFLGPVVGETTLGMTSFNKYINGTDPGTAGESYNYMRGLEANGDPQFCDGQETTFVLTGDPVAGTSCLDSDPADRRFMLSTGPITMNPGDQQRIVAAIIVGGEAGAGDRLSNVSLLKFYDLGAQDAFDRDFQIPAPPPLPNVLATEMDGEIVLSWGSDSQLLYDEDGYEFEGYNVYQGSSSSGPFKLLRTFDVVNGVAIINDDIFNPTKGGLEYVVVQQGSDAGVVHEFTITDDAIRGGPLRNARPYHFAVTAYSYGAAAAAGQKTLENSFDAAVTLAPQRMVSGVDLSRAAIGTLTYAPAEATIPPPTSVVTASVIEPSRVTGHNYRVEFYDVAPYTTIIDGVTYEGASRWRLIDTAAPPDTVLDDQFNVTGNNDFEVADGIQVHITGVFTPQIQSMGYQNDNATNNRALSWVNWGGTYFGGSWDSGCNWAGSSVVGTAAGLVGCPDATLDPNQFGTVELRFTGDTADPAPTGQFAYMYNRDELDDESGAAPPGGRGYSFEGYVPVPFTAWMTRGDQVDQCAVMFTQRRFIDATGGVSATQPESFDGLWNPTLEGAGGREYLNILAPDQVPYSETPDAAYQAPGLFFSGEIPVLYGGWFRKRSANYVVDEGDRFVITWGNPADANDAWTFSTTAAGGVTAGAIDPDFDLAKSRNDLKSIRVVPNPYLTRSAYELDQFNRVVKFINLPATCTVRIFTLAGDLVDTIEKEDANTSIVDWDLNSRFGLPIGSGIYVYHVEAPGIGNTFGKMAVFMEAERLQEF